MFFEDAWYVACWSRDLKDEPVPVQMLAEDIVLFRTSDAIAALDDRCPHRHLPLHLGKICGDVIQCGYHGAQFDANGQCVKVPSQKAAPSRVRARSYPVIERFGWVWVWMGDPDRADPDLLPAFDLMTNPDYATVGSTNMVAANYQLLLDNLMDLTHVGFVHTSTIGNTAMGDKATLTAERNGNSVRVVRWVKDAPPAPLAVKLGRFPAGTHIDRSQVIDYYPPTNILIHAGTSATSDGNEDFARHTMNFWVVNSITPCDEGRCRYFWASVRDIGVGDEQLDALVFEQHDIAFAEDKALLEEQYRVIAKHGDDWSNAFKADAGAVLARRCLNDVMAAS